MHLNKPPTPENAGDPDYSKEEEVSTRKSVDLPVS